MFQNFITNHALPSFDNFIGVAGLTGQGGTTLPAAVLDVLWASPVPLGYSHLALFQQYSLGDGAAAVASVSASLPIRVQSDNVAVTYSGQISFLGDGSATYYPIIGVIQNGTSAPLSSPDVFLRVCSGDRSVGNDSVAINGVEPIPTDLIYGSDGSQIGIPFFAWVIASSGGVSTIRCLDAAINVHTESIQTFQPLKC